MKGLNLVQAIARLSCVFKEKHGDLVVDYIGSADDPERALATSGSPRVFARGRVFTRSPARTTWVNSPAARPYGLLARAYPHRRVLAFGSRTTGRARRYSDLDLGVEGDQPLDIATYAALIDDLRESDLPFKVDVVDLAVVGEDFRVIVQRTGVPIA